MTRSGVATHSNPTTNLLQFDPQADKGSDESDCNESQELQKRVQLGYALSSDLGYSSTSSRTLVGSDTDTLSVGAASITRDVKGKFRGATGVAVDKVREEDKSSGDGDASVVRVYSCLRMS